MKRKHVAVWLAVTVALSALAGVSAATASSGSSQKNIVQTAVAAGQFKTLVSLVKQAGLAGALSGKAPLTVFAPTDAAFAKVPKATLAALAKDKAKLKAVLLYHVVPGKVTAAKVTMLNSAKTLEGSPVRISAMGGGVKINNAKVVKADIMASNGVIHVIDRVLIPGA
ncbi:MAG: fasciclin domain-containing protein [Verrucomicrobiota bacterium]